MRDKNIRFDVLLLVSFIINFGYAIYNLYLGISGLSIWFIIMASYYLILGSMKLYSLLKKKKYPDDRGKQYGTMRLMGCLFFILVATLILSIIVTMKFGLYKSHSTIIMITIASYTFYKVINAIINFRKARISKDPTIYTVRNINIAEALVSLLSLQMSMQQSFGDNAEESSHILNIVSGALVSLTIAILGAMMIYVSSKNLKVIKSPALTDGDNK